MNNELIEARFAIEKVLQPDGYYVGTTESSHSFAGLSYHIEVEQLIGSLCADIAAICKQHQVTFTVSGHDRNAVINLSN